MFGIPDNHIKNIYESKSEIVIYPIESLVEECGELVTALSKHLGCRFSSWDQSKSDIAGEMADVLVSMNLVANMLKITPQDIHNAILLKAVCDSFPISGYFEKEKNNE